jgi:hypothetical protein
VKKFIVALMLTLMTVPAFATELIEVKVTGLTAENASAIRKSLKALPELDIVEADAKTGYVELSCAKGYDITNMIVTQMLEKQGLKVVSVKRTGN